MGVRTHIKAEVPADKTQEALSVFGELVPGETPVGSHRPGTNVSWIEVVVPGDSIEAMEAKLAGMNTHGLRFTVTTTPY